MIQSEQQCFLYNTCNHKDCDKDFCLRKYKLDYLYNAAYLSDLQKKKLILRIDEDGTDLEVFKKLAEINNNIIEFVEAGRNLYIYSSQCGNGKTSWAIRLIQDYLNKIWPKTDLVCRALFVSVPRFLLSIKENISIKNEYANYIKDNILDADLVVFDDMFHKAVSEFEYNQLLNIIDTRISLGKSNIYTSNISPEYLKTNTDPRLYSRIINKSTIIELRGGDKRGIGGNN